MAQPVASDTRFSLISGLRRWRRDSIGAGRLDPAVDFSGTRQRQPIILQGEVPSPANPPSGCRFRSRCWKAQEICAGNAPVLGDGTEPGHQSACYFPEGDTTQA